MVELNKSGIYKIINTVTNKIYVGSALNILKRWYRHKTHANGGYHHSITFQRSWDLHGKDVFEIKVLEYCDKEKLAEREQLYLDWLKPYDPNVGYNICDSSTTQVGMKRSDQAKENMRQSQLGKTRSFEHRENIGLANSKPEKWPHGSRCLCVDCIKLRTMFAREKRWAKEDTKPYKGRKIEKWPHELGCYCKCDECKDKRNEIQRESRLDKRYG